MCYTDIRFYLIKTIKKCEGLMIMNFMQKVLFILGVTYAAIGVVVTAILLGIPAIRAASNGNTLNVLM